MSFQIIDNAAVTEPITLVEAKAYMQIDADYASNDAQINIAISAARMRLEQFLNVGLIKREIKVVWNGYKINLPLSPTSAIVDIKKNIETVAMDASLYTISGYPNKSAFINALSYNNFNYFYSFSGYVEITTKETYSTDYYTITYSTGHEALPSLLKQALLAEVDFIYKLRGLPSTVNISPNASMLASGFSNNLVLQ